ncbi:ATP-dependent RNA helicase dbp6 [Serendipita sp. 411]|nr:ATP-dependent RNA helicase dbp6 [Serendipita sp. 411]
MSEPAPTAKVKTKAKTRYLKTKKERRKKRKVLANASKLKTTKRDSPEEVEEEEDGEDVDVGHNVEEMEIVEESEAPLRQATVVGEGQDVEMRGDDISEEKIEKKPKKEKRPKKKRKIEGVDGEAFERDEEIVPVEEQTLVEDTTASTERKDGAPEAIVIPTFPVPNQPPPVSKVEAALQGMDSAMRNAEIVDPETTENLEEEESEIRKRLGPRMIKRLSELGIKELFAVQTALIPFLLPLEQEERFLYQPYKPPRDVCVSAPTGSGKTLAYVVPIVEILSTRTVTRLRALIIVPTRDLVQQVRETFETCCKGTKIQIATATGQHSFAHEQAQIVGNTTEGLIGGSSRVDILIATPGRLMDHINGTPNFSLQHLRFLVVDEADRLLNQSFQEWLKQVLAAIKPPSSRVNSTGGSAVLETPKTATSSLLQPDATSPAWLRSTFPQLRTELDVKAHSSCQKLLFSATLTQDPAKIAELDLRNPKYFIVRGIQAAKRHEGDMDIDDGVLAVDTFETPATLKEHMLVCESANKPLFLFYLAHSHGFTSALIFTKSAESTVRLLRLLEYFEAARASQNGAGQSTITAEAFSSDLTPIQRKDVLRRFKEQQVNMLICSDLISRGIDIPHVSHVVNYDVPVDVRKYIHRVGRTARAGKEGDAWTLIEEQEMHHFKAMMKEANHFTRIKKLKFKPDELQSFESYYQTALKRMKEYYVKGVK